MTSTAKTTQPTCPRLRPGTSERVKDSAVEVWAQWRASSAKTMAHAELRPDLARLLSPRLRLWRTLIQSSRKPMIPNDTTAAMARYPVREKRIWVPMCPRA